MTLECPKCKSKHTDIVELMGSKFLICLSCGYDESDDVLDVYEEGRGGKGGKGSPYKKGGAMRSMNRSSGKH